MDVSIDEILEYYKNKSIDDFPKTKNGNPNMSFKMNKEVKCKLMKQKILDKNKKENIDNYKKNNEKYFRDEILDLDDEELDEYNKLNPLCSICNESMITNHCKLKCNHMFCCSCIINHCQTKNNCPLCRNKICDIINKPEKHNMVNNIIEDPQSIINYLVAEEDKYYCCNDEENESIPEINSQGKTFRDYLKEEITDLKTMVTMIMENKTSKGDFDLYIDNMSDILCQNIYELLYGTIDYVNEMHDVSTE